MKAYHARFPGDRTRRLARGALSGLTLALAAGPTACAKGCSEGEAPLSMGAPPSAGTEHLLYASPAAAPSSVARFLARRARASGLGFYRVSSSSAGAAIDVAPDSAATVKADFDSALRVDLYVLDETTRAFAGRESEAPFPALSVGAELRIAKEHQSALERFTRSVAAPADRLLLVGHSGDDEFAHTWVVAAPAVVGGESITQLAVTSEGGAWGVALYFDEAGRAKLDARTREADGDRARIVVALDGRVRRVSAAKRALEGGRTFVTLGAGEVARAEAQSYEVRYKGAARGTDLALSAPP